MTNNISMAEKDSYDFVALNNARSVISKCSAWVVIFNVSSSLCGKLYNNPDTILFQVDDFNPSVSNTVDGNIKTVYPEILWYTNVCLLSKSLDKNTQFNYQGANNYLSSKFSMNYIMLSYRQIKIQFFT